MPTTPDQMGAAIVANLPRKTGRTLEEWIALVRAEGPERRKERVEWLKREHKLGHVTAETIVARAEQPGDYTPPTGAELLAAQFAGPKAALRPVYDRLAQAVQTLGSDVQLDPRKTYVSLIRERQFGIIQASTKTRLDLGLKLRGAAPTDRLRAAGSFGSGSMSHRVALTAPRDVDEELLGWLRAAYEGDR
jgi:predicted transport protein